MSLIFQESFVQESLNIIKNIPKATKVFLSFSGGKDSTALLGLFLYAKQLKFIESFEVLHSDTTMEIPLLNVHITNSSKICFDNDIKFNHLKPLHKDRFLYNLIGRGLSTPNRGFRWCTGRLKIQPMRKVWSLYEKSGKSFYVVNGERLGESVNRDKKLKKTFNSCSNGDNECGVSDISKSIVTDVEDKNLIRPLINWSSCQVWDFIFALEQSDILPDAFSILQDCYSLDEMKKGESLRTGCIGCPLISKDKSLLKFVEKYPGYKSLIEVHEIYQNLAKPENRLMRPDGKSYGALKISSRKKAWLKILMIEKDVQKNYPEFKICDDMEKKMIFQALKDRTYPKGYEHMRNIKD